MQKMHSQKIFMWVITRLSLCINLLSTLSNGAHSFSLSSLDISR